MIYMSIIAQGLTFTDAAVSKINELLIQKENEGLLFRVKVTGGGCSGLQYGFALDQDIVEEGGEADDLFTNEEENNEEDDLFDDDALDNTQSIKNYIFKDDNTPIAIVDLQSLEHLQECTVDYVEDLTNAQFIIHNPKAKAKCGCGNSFTY